MQIKEVEKGPLLGQRHLQTLLLFLVVVLSYSLQLNASVSIVAMTNAATTNPNFEEYDWTKMQKSVIISSFYWGFILTQLPGGYMGCRFGNRKIMFISIFGAAVLTVMTPFGVRYAGWQAYCCIRILQGMFQGLLLPCVQAHLAAWCPPQEINRLGAFVYMGIECGSIVAMFVSGMIAASSLGWPGISYMSCLISGIWCLFWLIFSANNPSESKFISEAELNYIKESQNATKEKSCTKNTTKINIPWLAIFTSVPFLTTIFTRACGNWGFFTLQAELPPYMHNILDLDMKANALYSAIPFVVMLVLSNVLLVLSDVLIGRNILTLNAVRKSFNSLGCYLPAALLIALGFLNKDQKPLAIALMSISVACNAACTIGSTLNTIDLSPNHAGILMGISNTLTALITIVAPLFSGLILKDETNRLEWQIIFATSALIYFVGNTVYLIFGSMNVQPWDDENFSKKKCLEQQ